MAGNSHITPAELASLREIGTGFSHEPVPDAHAARLLELRLIYSLLGEFRITSAGRARLVS